MEEDKPTGDDGEDLERERLAPGSFTLAKALGRIAGRDLMKGASPVTRKRQAEVEIELYLEKHLDDPEGALLVVLQRRVRESADLLASRYQQPLAALAEVAEHLLESEERLQSFVQQVDVEWGRIYLERPHFQRPGQAPHRDDPYTFASVRATLLRLLEELRSD